MVEQAKWYNGGLENLLGKTYKEGLKVRAYDRYTGKIEEIELSSYLDALKLKLRGFVGIGERQYPGWSGSIPFYLYTCKLNDSNGKKEKVLMIDYPHGYYERLDCKL
jgi:hypothetical protein